MSAEKGLNVTITERSQDIINKFISTGFFADQKDVAKIAISYALSKDSTEEIDLNNYVIGNKDEQMLNKWAIGTINEPYFLDVLNVLRPEVKNINIALRNLIDIGLKDMYDDLWDESINKIKLKSFFE